MLPVNDFIYIRLSKNHTGEGEAIDGAGTMRIYEDYLWGHSDVWFGTNALATGMDPVKVRHYLDLLKDQEVRVLFAYHDRTDSDIRYSARVLDIVSKKEPIGPPDPIMMPDEYRGDRRRIWLRITDLRREEKLSARSFRVTSNGKNLKDTMISQTCFAYVEYMT